MGPPTPFSATVEVLNGVTTVVLQGELDMSAAPQLERLLASLVERGPDEVVLDFAALDFIDSSGLSVLITAQQELEERGRHLTVRAARAHAVKVFEISGLTSLLDVRGSDPD